MGGRATLRRTGSHSLRDRGARAGHDGLDIGRLPRRALLDVHTVVVHSAVRCPHTTSPRAVLARIVLRDSWGRVLRNTPRGRRCDGGLTNGRRWSAITSIRARSRARRATRRRARVTAGAGQSIVAGDATAASRQSLARPRASRRICRQGPFTRRCQKHIIGAGGPYAGANSGSLAGSGAGRRAMPRRASDLWCRRCTVTTCPRSR